MKKNLGLINRPNPQILVAMRRGLGSNKEEAFLEMGISDQIIFK